MATLSVPPGIMSVCRNGIYYQVTNGTVTVPDDLVADLVAAGFNGGVPAAASAPDATLGKVTARRVVVGDDLDTPGWPYATEFNQSLVCGTDGGGVGVSMYHDWTVPDGMAGAWMTGLDNSISLGGTTTATKPSVDNSHFAWTKNGFSAPSLGTLTGLAASAQHYGTVATIDKLRALAAIPANAGVGQCAEMDGLEVILIPGNTLNVYGVSVTNTTGGQNLIGVRVGNMTPANGGKAWAIKTGLGMVQFGDEDETTFPDAGQGWLEPGRVLIHHHHLGSAAADVVAILTDSSSPLWFCGFSSLAVHKAGAKTQAHIGIAGNGVSTHPTGNITENVGVGGYTWHNGAGTVGRMVSVMAWEASVEPGAGAVTLTCGFYTQRQHGAMTSVGHYTERHTYTDPAEHAAYCEGGRISYPEGLTFQVRAGAPTAAQVPSGQFQVWKDTSTGALKLWANDGGTLKSVALS